MDTPLRRKRSPWLRTDGAPPLLTPFRRDSSARRTSSAGWMRCSRCATSVCRGCSIAAAAAACRHWSNNPRFPARPAGADAQRLSFCSIPGHPRLAGIRWVAPPPMLLTAAACWCNPPPAAGAPQAPCHCCPAHLLLTRNPPPSRCAAPAAAGPEPPSLEEELALLKYYASKLQHACREVGASGLL